MSGLGTVDRKLRLGVNDRRCVESAADSIRLVGVTGRGRWEDSCRNEPNRTVQVDD